MKTFLTSVAQCVGISRFTSRVTVPILFITWRVIPTVTTTVVDTVITICSILTFCSNEELYLSLHIKCQAVLSNIFQLLDFHTNSVSKALTSIPFEGFC